MRRLFPALLTTLALTTAAMAQDIPLPHKKPKDARGQPVTSGTVSKTENSVKPAPTLQTQSGAAKSGRSGAATNASTSNSGKPDKGPTAAWPKTLDDAKAEAKAKADPKPEATEWPADEIAAASALCKTILAKIDAVAIPEQPFRKGECGAAAPVRLISIGRKPEVALSPPPILTCGMVGALHTWLTKDLQPLAKKHLGSDLIRIDSMSDYSCRNAYGRTKTKLSEHGRANALDIRGFVTAKGETAAVLTGWGETERDIAARALAAKKAAEKSAAAAAAAATTARKDSTAQMAPSAAGDTPAVRSTIIEGTSPPQAPSSFSIAPSQLGGPDQAPQPPARMRSFLKAAHAAACKIFGTTLGPEANNAHRNHFHVDMAPRSRSNFCE